MTFSSPRFCNFLSMYRLVGVAIMLLFIHLFYTLEICKFISLSTVILLC
jgi:hypothetical protein